MNSLIIENLDLKLTLFSGQTFSWEFDGEFFIGTFQNKLLKIKIGKKENEILWQTYPQKDDFEFIKKYFEIEHDYQKSLKDINIDNAIKKYNGLRILNQDFEQTLFSFLLAQHKNIKAIRKSLDIIKKSYNKRINVQDKTYFLFPNADFYYSVDEDILKQAGVGYRLKYLKDAAQKIINNEIYLGNDYLKTKDELLKIKGVGNKVADCILCFSLNQKDITPIDIWGDRIIRNLYKNKRSKSYEQKSKWFTKKFGENTALAGQFLFEYIRNYKPEEYMDKLY